MTTTRLPSADSVDTILQDRRQRSTHYARLVVLLSVCFGLTALPFERVSQRQTDSQAPPLTVTATTPNDRTNLQQRRRLAPETRLYTSPLEEFPNHLQKPLPPPMAVLEQYKAWHSHEALERDPYNRTYIVAHYQCPISAGNWMHYFTSAFMWGM